MTEATVAADLHQTGDVLPHLAAKIALGGVVGIDEVTNLGDLVLSQVLDASGRINTSLRADLGGAGAADAENVSESDLLALTLLVARVLADDVNLAVATNNLALVAHLLDRRTYLHESFLSVVLIRTYLLAQPLA